MAKRPTYIKKQVYLNRREDADLIAYLGQQRNESETIRAALRAYVIGSGITPAGEIQIDMAALVEAVAGVVRETIEAALERLQPVDSAEPDGFEADFNLDSLLAD